VSIQAQEQIHPGVNAGGEQGDTDPLLEIVKGLSPEQWSFREKPERWSIAKILSTSSL
jgi:hypothetical protein